MSHGIVVKIHSSRTGLEPTTSMSPTRLAKLVKPALTDPHLPKPKMTNSNLNLCGEHHV